ncbi:MAG: NUDIX domain-containing protein [Candidatus Aenigmatarchaeota archaeon]
MREDGVDLVEVHVSGICFFGDSVLVAKRAPNREIYPNLWECGGGQVKKWENFGEAAIRQLKEELGVVAMVLAPFKAYEIPPKFPNGPNRNELSGINPNRNELSGINAKIPGIRFICRLEGFLDGNSPKLSKEHTEWKILPVNKIDGLEFIPGLKEDIEAALTLSKSI